MLLAPGAILPRADAAPIRVQVPVIVNLYQDSGVTKDGATDFIKDANKLLAQAGYTLVPVKFNNVNQTSELTRADRDQARTAGGQAIKQDIPNQRGLKIDFVKQSDKGNPGTDGVAVHKDPTLIVNPVAGSTNGIRNTGYTIAHEVAHVLTIPGHSAGADDIMQPSGYTGTKFTAAQITEMQTQRYIVGKCSTQFKAAFPAMKDAEQFGAAANFTNPGAATGLAALHRVDLTALDAAADQTGGDTANVFSRFTLPGLLPATGSATLGYALGFDTDGLAGTGISYAGQAGIDRLVYVTGAGNQAGWSLAGTVVDTDNPLFPSTPLPQVPVLGVESEFLDALGGGTGAIDPLATTIQFLVPKSLLSGLPLPAANLPAVAASIDPGADATDPADDTILMASTDLSFNTRAYLDDPTLTTFGTGIPVAGQPYAFNVTGLTPNDTFHLLLNGDSIFSATLDAAGSYTGSFVFPATLPVSETYALAAQDSSGEFAYNNTCPKVADTRATVPLLLAGISGLLLLRRRGKAEN